MPKRSAHGRSEKRKSFNVKTHDARSNTSSQVNCKSKAATNPYRQVPGHEDDTGFRTKAKIKLLNMYNQKPDTAKTHLRPLHPARIEPDRRWFGNTRVLAQKELDKLRTEVEQQQAKHDPYTIVINQRKLPMQLLSDASAGTGCPKILAVEPFSVLPSSAIPTIGNHRTHQASQEAQARVL